MQPFEGRAEPGLVVFFLFLMLLEVFCPLRRRIYPWIPRLRVNACLGGLTFLVGAFVVYPVAFSLAHWSFERSVGLLYLVGLPAGARFALAFLLMDLTFYYWHLANHKVPLLWRFHNVHHIDPDLDVSTAFRFHVGEVALSVGFRAVQVVLIGVSPLSYILYELAFQGSTLFHHSNIRLPVRIERAFNTVWVTPRMHGIHHSIVEQETNANYSVIFSWWDRLHKSLRLHIPQSALVIGVPAYQEPEDNTLSRAIMLPFRTQRPYWYRRDGTRPERHVADIAGAKTHMAA